jgi:hypothetical protein
VSSMGFPIPRRDSPQFALGKQQIFFGSRHVVSAFLGVRGALGAADVDICAIRVALRQSPVVWIADHV